MGVLDRPLIRFLAALIALIAALAAQRLTATSPFALQGWGLYGMAALLFAVATWTRATPENGAAARPLATPAGKPALRLSVALAACVALGAAIWLSETENHPWISLALWLVAAAAAAAGLRGWRIVAPLRSSPAWTARELTTLAAIAVVAAVARLAWLDSIPYHVIGDEPRVAAQVFRYGRGELRSFFHMGWNTWPNLGMALQGLFTPLFGVHTTTLKMSSAFVGTLAVATTYMLARELFSRRVAVLTAVLFAICRTAIDFSRLGVCHAQVMLWGSLAIALWFRALNTGKAVTFFASGFVVGLCLYTYNAGQSFPPLLFSWIAITALFHPAAIRTHAKAVALVVAGFVLCVSPLVYHITDHFQFLHNWVEWTHMARNRQVVDQIVAVWNAQGWEAARPFVYRQVFGTALGFTTIPAGAYGIGYRGGGMLDHVSSALFVLGFGMLLTRLLRREAVVLYWFVVSAFIGSVLTDDPPATVRMVGLVPPLPIMAALSLSALIDLSQKTKALRSFGIALATLLLAGAAYDTWQTYFVTYAATEPDGPTDLARRLDRMPASNRARLLGAEHFLRFGDELFDINFAGRDLRNVEEPAHFLPVHTATHTPLVVVLTPAQLDLLPHLRRLYPKADVFELYSRNDQKILYRMATLSPQELVERTGLTMKVDDGAGIVADPFDAVAGETQGRIEWSGRVYWPTDRAATLHIESARAGELRIGERLRRQLAAGEPAQESVELPVGWIPISLSEAPGAKRGLSIRIEHDDQTLALDRWSIRPEAAAEGLRALYSRDGNTLLRRIDPQLNVFANEGFWEAPRDDLVIRSPFSVDWSGALHTPSSGTYTFTVAASGPYSVELAGARLCQAADVVPERPQQCTVSRELNQGTHPIKVHWDSRPTPNSVRRMFQLYWIPPGGERELVPPTQLSPEPLG